MPRRSLPICGSDMAMTAMSSPLISLGSQRAFWSSEP